MTTEHKARELHEIHDRWLAEETDEGFIEYLARALESAQQPAAEPRSTHRVWRRNDWLPCYCEATSDHHIGCEQPEPQAVEQACVAHATAAKDAEIERLRGALEECHALSVARWRRLLAAEAENERLRKALEEIRSRS